MFAFNPFTGRLDYYKDTDISGLQPLDADLTAIAALGFTATAFLKKTAEGTWALDTNTYLTASDIAGFVPYTGASADLNLGVHNISAANLAISNWNTAYGWGNHASAGYSTQTLSLGTTTQIPYMNIGGTDYLYSDNFVFSGTKLTVTGDIKVSNFLRYLDADTLGTDCVFLGVNAGAANAAGALNNIAIGSSALRYNPTGDANIAIGTEAGQGVAGNENSYNTWIGWKAGKNVTTGSQNVGIGAQALESITTGSGNFVLGHNAGYALRTGWDNFVLGWQAMFNNVSGSTNICIGYSAGRGVSNQSYSNNIFMGYYCGQNISTGGTENLMIGHYAGIEITTGDYNVYYGNRAGYYNKTGSNNVFVGHRAGYGVTAQNNSGNTFLGYQAGDSVTTGSYNILIGYDIDLASPSFDYSLNIGGILKGSMASGSEYLLLPFDKPFYFGEGADATITYDGTNWLFNPKVVGTGYMNIQGQLLMDDKIMFTQTDGNEYIDSLADGELDLGATTAINMRSDTVFVGAGTGLPYGSMYIYNLGTGATTITVSVVDTWYEITTGVTGGTTNLITFQNNHELLVAKAGTYKVTWSLALECASANQEVEGTIAINSTANTSFAGMNELISANKAVQLSGTGIITLAANDVISLAVLNHTGANNITIDHLTISVEMVGG